MLNRFLHSLLTRAEKLLGHLGTHVSFNYALFAAVFLLGAASFWLLYEVRFDFHVPAAWITQRWLVLPYAACLKVVVFYILRDTR